MKYQKPISYLVVFISLFSIVATTYAVFSRQGPGAHEYQSIFGQTVTIYGKGLYQHDSVSMAVQAIAQDYVTLILGVPLLLLSLYFSRKGLLKGKLLLTGTLGYFLYTYASYSFLAMYNPFFLIYVLLMSLSFFAFTLAMLSFDISKLPSSFHEKLPVAFIGSFLIVVSAVFELMWLGKIVPALLNNHSPEGIDHYTTLVIQALDLGIVLPAGILSGILLLKRKPFGYLLASVIITKEITLLTSLTGMLILQISTGISISPAIICIVLLFNILVIYIMFLILKNVKEVSGTTRGQMSF